MESLNEKTNSRKVFIALMEKNIFTFFPDVSKSDTEEDAHSPKLQDEIILPSHYGIKYNQK